MCLWRAPHPNWDVWTAPARVWSEDAPETPAKDKDRMRHRSMCRKIQFCVSKIIK